MVEFIVCFDPYNTWGFTKSRERKYTGDSYMVDEDGNLAIDRTSESKPPTTIAKGKWLSIEAI